MARASASSFLGPGLPTAQNKAAQMRRQPETCQLLLTLVHTLKTSLSGQARQRLAS